MREKEHLPLPSSLQARRQGNHLKILTTLGALPDTYDSGAEFLITVLRVTLTLKRL